MVVRAEVGRVSGDRSHGRRCRRILHRHPSVPVAFAAFDVLELDGGPTVRLPYRERREIVESLTSGRGVQVCPRFDEGPALWASVLEHPLEGVVAKRLNEPYRPGERSWIKRKNRAWHGMRRSARRQFASDYGGTDGRGGKVATPQPSTCASTRRGRLRRSKTRG
jgi:hypothetical protein